MPVYRQEKLERKWGSKRLFLGANAERRSTAMNLRNLGKLTCPRCPHTFRNNDSRVLANAISVGRGGPGGAFFTGKGAGLGVAAARAPEPMVIEVHKYLGRVKSVERDNVIAEIGPADDMDRWDVVIPRATFWEQPKVNEEIACRIVRFGSHARITAHVLSNKPLPELKDFGINEEELLKWASQVNV